MQQATPVTIHFRLFDQHLGFRGSFLCQSSRRQGPSRPTTSKSLSDKWETAGCSSIRTEKTLRRRSGDAAATASGSGPFVASEGVAPARITAQTVRSMRKTSRTGFGIFTASQLGRLPRVTLELAPVCARGLRPASLKPWESYARAASVG
jgi:hypothetical protein